MGYPDTLHPSLIAKTDKFAGQYLELGEQLQVSCSSKLGWARKRWFSILMPRSVYLSVTDRRVLFYSPTWWGDMPDHLIATKALNSVYVVDKERRVILASDVGRYRGKHFFTLSDTFSDEAAKVVRLLPAAEAQQYETPLQRQNRFIFLMVVAVVASGLLAGVVSVLLQKM